MKWKERISFIVFSIILLCTLHFYKEWVLNTEPPTNDLQRKRTSKNSQQTTLMINRSITEIHPWDIWEEMVDGRYITSPSTKHINLILNEMATARIIKADVGHKGTQLKAQLTLAGPQNNQVVVFKPKRYLRDRVLEGTPYEGFDRHNGEIAAFHLDVLLEFYRAPPVVGRKVNLTTEFMPVTEKKLLSTFYVKDENICFYGKCMYCKKSDSACANGEIMEASLTIWIPPKWKLYIMKHPWQRTYSTKRKAKWEIDPSYCEDVKKKQHYRHGPLLLDLMDTAIFDFLIGNADRHHYEYINNANTGSSTVLHLDNGKSFGNPHHDEISILTPIKQCCMLRHSTFLSIGSFISDFDKELSLSYKLEQKLKGDPIYPILTKDHLTALDRRLNIIFKTLEVCFKTKGKKKVLVDK